MQIPSLPPGRSLEDGHGRWLVYDTSVNGTPVWLQSALFDPLQELQRLSAFVFSLADALDALHRQSLVWLNFDPNALEDLGPLTPSADRRSLRITNLDLDLFPFQSMPERVRVHPHYAAPEVVQFRVDDIGPRTDVYHLAMFAYYWLAGLLPDGLPGGGLERYDYDLPFLRVFTPRLAEGIIPVVMRGCLTAIRLLNGATFGNAPMAFAEAALAQCIARVRSSGALHGSTLQLGHRRAFSRARLRSNRSCSEATKTTS